MSHGGSGKQARAVIDGLEADVVTLALQDDIDADRQGDRQDPGRLAHASCRPTPRPTPRRSCSWSARETRRTSSDWNDLVAARRASITPNPKTSGGARWNYLAAWAYARKQFAGDEAKIREFVGAIYKNVASARHRRARLDHDVRAAGHGDVLITWENEAFLALERVRRRQFEIVYPSLSILAEPPVAVVDGNADKHGTRKVAEDYLKYLYSPEGQEIAAKHYYRPVDPAVADPADVARFQQIEMVTIDDPLFGGWDEAQPKHFDDGGVFDQIYQPAR